MVKRFRFRWGAIVLSVIIASLLVPAIRSWRTVAAADYRKAFELWRRITPPLTLEESTENLVKYRASILDTAAAFQVDPLVIGGVIFAEQTLNRNPANYFEDYYVRSYLLTLSEDDLHRQLERTREELQRLNADEHGGWGVSFRSHHPLTWSIGLGRVSVLTALELEDELYIYENRERRGIRRVLEALLDPQENLRYCAFALRRNKAIYSGITGYDISDRPDIQASLYNIGHVRVVARRTVGEKRRPLPNTFGRYVESHIEEVRAALYGPLKQKVSSVVAREGRY